MKELVTILLVVATWNIIGLPFNEKQYSCSMAMIYSNMKRSGAVVIFFIDITTSEWKEFEVTVWQ